MSQKIYKSHPRTVFLPLALARAAASLTQQAMHLSNALKKSPLARMFFNSFLTADLTANAITIPPLIFFRQKTNILLYLGRYLNYSHTYLFSIELHNNLNLQDDYFFGMILSDRDIREYLKQGKLNIEPLKNPDKQIQAAWVDLTLGNEFRTFKSSSVSIIDTKSPLDGYTELIKIDDDKSFVLHPGEFVLGTVKEYIKMPDDLMGVVDGRSSLGRLGVVVHSTSAGINPGWEGMFTLEISNVGKIPVILYPNMRICKLVLHKLSSPAEKPYNLRKDAKYQKQMGLEESKIFKDFSEQ